MLKTVWLMLKEEFRLHTSKVYKLEVLLFPILNFVFILLCALLSPKLTKSIDLHYFFYMACSGLFLYGVFMGAFVFFGRDYVERQFGKVAFLISTPLLHPVSFRKILLAYFLHDVIFYFVFTITPTSLALLIATPIMGFHIVSVLMVILCSTLSFLLGISISFFAANLFIRSLPAFVAFSVLMGAFITLVVLIPGYEFLFPAYMFQITRQWGYLLASFTLPVLALALGLILVTERPVQKASVIHASYGLDKRRYRIFKEYSTLVAKEMLDVRRSKMLTKILFSFIVPLIMISFGSWMMRTGLEIEMDFNLIFYASLVGFFGIMIYSFLNFTDATDYYEVLPISVPQLIKAKLIVFAILTTIVSTVFLLVMTVIMGQYLYLPLAFIVMFITSSYMVVTTAYLTGLRTNSSLFNINILIKFNCMATLPLGLVTITSFIIGTHFVVATMTILAMCTVLLVVTYILYRKIDDKWKKASFLA